MHIRTRLRNAAKAALSTHATLVAGKVQAVRAYGRNTGTLPCIEVTTPASTAQRISDDGDYRHNLTLTCLIYAAGHEDLETAMDAIGEQVEATVLQVVQTGEWNVSVQEIQTEFDAGESGENRIGTLAVVFGLLAFTDETNPQGDPL